MQLAPVFIVNSIRLAHDHPLGNPEQSRLDMEVEERLVKASNLFLSQRVKKRRHINGIDVSILEPYNGYKEKFIYGNKHIDRACKSAVIKV